MSNYDLPSDAAIWEKLYEKLLDILEPYGKASEDGEKNSDYWLVTDQYWSPEHKMYVFNPDLRMGGIIESIQNALVKEYPEWSVIVVYDDGSGREGLRVRGDRLIRQSEEEAEK